MHIGIIGSGIAGLVAARNLQQEGHRVTVIERQPTVGLDAHSMDIPGLSGDESVRADVPSRMFNQNGWPALFRLYEELAIEAAPVEMTQSFSNWEGKTWLRLDQANRTESMFAVIPGTKRTRILRQAVRLREIGRRDRLETETQGLTLWDYLHRNGFSEEFILEFLYPTLSSTVCTCSFESLNRYPAATILGILDHLTSNVALLRSRFGTSAVAERILQANFDLKLNLEIDAISVEEDQVTVIRNRRPVGTFDHLVIATQANTARRLLPAAEREAFDILGAVRYESIPVFVHTDFRFMPKREKDWSTFNMQLAANRSQAMCTVWLNRFHDHWSLPDPVFQTINAFQRPDESKTIGRWVLQRPVVTDDSESAWKAIARLNRQAERRIWLCGSYASPGTPLLESGVVSANAVAAAIRERTTELA